MNAPGWGHAPGVRCIVTGLHDPWTSQDNGRIVLIQQLVRITKRGPIWEVVPVPPDTRPFHVYSTIKFERRRKSWVYARQRNLIPIGPEGMLDEQVTGRQADTRKRVPVKQGRRDKSVSKA